MFLTNPNMLKNPFDNYINYNLNLKAICFQIKKGAYISNRAILKVQSNTMSSIGNMNPVENDCSISLELIPALCRA